MDIAGIQRQNGRKIRLNIDLLSIQLQKSITHLDAVFAGDQASFFDGRNGRHDKLLGRGKNNGKNQHTGNKIHHRACHQDDQSLPPDGFLEGTGIISVLFFPFHSAIAANGNATQRIKSFTDLLLINRRPHKQSKFIDLNTGQFRCHKMAQFMNEDQ